jgi:hypothetical protein
MSKSPQYIVIKQNELKKYMHSDLKCFVDLDIVEACSLASALNTGALSEESLSLSDVDYAYNTLELENHSLWCILKKYN